MDNQDSTNANSPSKPNESIITTPIQKGITPQVDPEEEKELQEIEKLKDQEESEELADAKAVDEREKESKIMEDIEKKDPKLVLTENATPPTDSTTPNEK